MRWDGGHAEVLTGAGGPGTGSAPRVACATPKVLGHAAPPLTLSPDGRIVAVGDSNGAIHLWNIFTARELPPLVGHRGAVRALRYAPDGKTLWSLGWDNKVLTWRVVDVVRDWRPQPVKASPTTLAALWNDLGAEDALTSYGAAANLAAVPEQTLTFFRTHLQPVPPVDSQRITQLVADLGKEDFNERKRAAVELRQFGELAIPALWGASEKHVGRDEVPRRLLAKLQNRYPTPAQLHQFRALEVLEQIGSPAARDFLKALADGAPEAGLSRRAKAALDRLSHRLAAYGAEVPLGALWNALADEDAPQAYRAMLTLAGRGDQAIAFLGDQLRALAAQKTFDDDPQRIAQLITDLDSSNFKVRQRAVQELRNLGKLAEAALRKALARGPSLESARRIEQLLTELASPIPPRDQLQVLRAVEVLEHLGTDQARLTLTALAREVRSRALKEELTRALERLASASPTR